MYVAYGAVVGAVGVVALWLAMFVARTPRAAVAMSGAAARVALACLGCRIVVRGAWPGGDVGPCVYVANHSSYLDILVMLAAMNRDFAFVTKRELLDWPFFARITRAGGHITVDRDRLESRGAVVGRIVKALRGGRSVLVFPEGTFSHDDGLRAFQAGAFKAALAAGVPVVPLAAKGVAEVWSQHAPFPRPGAIEIEVGPALAPDPALDEAARLEALRDAAVAFIATHTGLASPRA